MPEDGAIAPPTRAAAARLPLRSPRQPAERTATLPTVEPHAGLPEEGEEQQVFLPLASATAARVAAAHLPLRSPRQSVERAAAPPTVEPQDNRSLQLGVRASGSSGGRRRNSVGLTATAPQLSPPVLEDDWGTERTFDAEDGMDDTHSDNGEDDGTATMAPPAVVPPRASARARMSGNGVLGNDGKFAPPRVRI